MWHKHKGGALGLQRRSNSCAAPRNDPPVCSSVVRRREMRRLSRPTSFQPPAIGMCSSSELGTTTRSESSSLGTCVCAWWGLGGGLHEELGSDRGGGGMSSKNQSCCAMRNSRTRWLSACSPGDISWLGWDIRPGRKITARSAQEENENKDSRREVWRTCGSHKILI